MKADKSSIDAKIESMETMGSIVLAARDHKAIFDFMRVQFTGREIGLIHRWYIATRTSQPAKPRKSWEK